MKKGSITVQFDDSKLNATRLYAQKKGTDIDQEMEKCIAALYEKFVPKDTREYIEMQTSKAAPKPKSAPRTRESKQATPSNGNASGTNSAGQPVTLPKEGDNHAQ